MTMIESTPKRTGPNMELCGIPELMRNLEGGQWVFRGSATALLLSGSPPLSSA